MDKIEPKFKVGDVLHRHGYIDHKVVSIFENRVYVCEIDDDGPCESHISVEDQDKWSLSEIPFNDSSQNCSLDSLIGNLVQDVVANEHGHDTFGGEKKPSKYFIEKYLPMFEAFIKNKEPEKPKHSYISNVYYVGSEPTWKVGDTLAYYIFTTDEEGECVYGTVTEVHFDEEYNDWCYQFKDYPPYMGDGVIYEEELISSEAYKVK